MSFTAQRLKTVTATKYVTPLREGGSLPAIVEADDDQLYVMKFVGGGHGHRALIAELLAGEIGRALGLRVPEIVFIHLDPALGRSEPNPEIRDLLRASAGLNLGLRYLPEAFAFAPPLAPPPSPIDAAAVVWFDAFVTNVDRTPRNVNLLVWRNALWLIDHGAALYFHYNWDGYLERSRTPFAAIKDHVLLPLAGDLRRADAGLRGRLTRDLFQGIVALIPDNWLGDEPSFALPSEHRAGYASFLWSRLQAANLFVEEAERARTQLL